MDGNTNTPWIELAHARLRKLDTEQRAQLEDLDVSPTDLVQACVVRLLQRFAKAAKTPERDSFNGALETVNFADLGLAIAWEQGHPEAWECYADQFRRPVIAAAVRQGAGHGSAEELADELPGYLLAAQAEGLTSPLARYDGTGSLRGWLCTIVRRRMLDSARRTSKNEELPAESMATEESSPTHTAEQNEMGQRLQAAGEMLRESMSPRERLAFLLKYEKNLPQRQIAKMMKIGDSRVSRLIQQGYTKVREALATEFGEDIAREPLPPDELLLALGSRQDGHRHPSSPQDGPQEKQAQ
jgi:RNA polymerase sigma factor (sigma-70 family)